MGAVTTLPAFLDALRTALAARAGLSGVNVYTADVDPESAGTEFIILGGEEIAIEMERPLAAATRVFETYSVPCFLQILKPGAGETIIKSARDRAMALLEEVVDYLQSVKGTAAMTSALGVRKAYVTNVRMSQDIRDAARTCQLFFDIAVEAHFDPA